MEPVKKARRWYAEYRRYGLNSFSDSDTLMAFDTPEKRDLVVKALNGDPRYDHIVEGVARAITRKEANKYYRTQDLGTELEHEVHFDCDDRLCDFDLGFYRCSEVFSKLF